LKYIVDPTRLFGNYVYKSGASNFFQNHFKDLARSIARGIHDKDRYVLEVGSNDGVLLNELTANGIDCIGVEPSFALVQDCIKRNLKVYEAFFDDTFVDTLITNHGLASLVVGNNVFAHINDLKKAFENVHKVLDPKGKFIFEVAHLKNIITDGIFDTIYHEHMSYHSVYSMQKFVKLTGFKLVNVEKINSHGGSLRFYLTKDLTEEIQASVKEIIDEELSLGLENNSVLERIGLDIVEKKLNIDEKIEELISSNIKYFVGYGAPAKVVTFLAQMRLEDIGIICVIDDNILKQGKFLPSSGIEVVSVERMKELLAKQNLLDNGSTACFIFPWNLKAEIRSKLKNILPEGSKSVTFFPNIEVAEFL
jgi:SAM-dependent methyltransferase